MSVGVSVLLFFQHRGTKEKTEENTTEQAMGSVVSLASRAPGASHAMDAALADQADSAAFTVLPHLSRSPYLAAVPAQFVQRVSPVPVQAPRLMLFNDALADELEIDAVRAKTAAGAAVFSGNFVHHSWEPYAHAYSGHQFQQFSELGDGRVATLGALRGVEVQLKGSGRTRYSRGGDGRATLASVLREYVVSEAMHALGIRTTRGLACVDTGDYVARAAGQERGGVLTRTSPGFVRIGTFERLSRPRLLQVGIARRDGTFKPLLAQTSGKGAVHALADFVIAQHYPAHAKKTGAKKYIDFCLDVCTQYGALVAAWMCVGFVHGVMNTDNVLVSSVATIDYGPCAFLDEYDPTRVFSSIDRTGMYSFENQPNAGAWNCTRFLRALKGTAGAGQGSPGKGVDVGDLDEHACSEAFFIAYLDAWDRGMAAKIGITWASVADTDLVRELLRLMARSAADYTLTFRELADTGTLSAPVFRKWMDAWTRRVQQEKVELNDMKQRNPVYVPRNHIVNAAIHAATKRGDCTQLRKLVRCLANPFERCDDFAAFELGPTITERVAQTFCGT